MVWKSTNPVITHSEEFIKVYNLLRLTYIISLSSININHKIGNEVKDKFPVIFTKDLLKLNDQKFITMYKTIVTEVLLGFSSFISTFITELFLNCHFCLIHT